MQTSSARARRANRLSRLLAASAVVAGAATAVVAGPATATPGGGNWERIVRPSLSRGDLGLPKGASVQRLAAGAIVRSAPKLVKGGELGGLRFLGEPLAARSGQHALRFTQRLNGLRVLWSEYDVAVARGEVTSIVGTVIPLRDTRLTGKVNLTAARAKAIGLRAAPGDGDSARTPELVAYAGSPDRPKAPRRAFVVDVAPARFTDDVPSDLCVVVDAQSGRILATWRGSAARKPQPTGKASAAGAQARAAGKTVLNQIIDAGDRDVIVSPNYRDLTTMGNPYLFGSDFGLGVDTYGTGMSPGDAATAQSWTTDVSAFMCKNRGFCGRDSGQPGPVGGGTYNRNFFTVNWAGRPGQAGQYDPATERIYIDSEASNYPGAIAHEFGHQIDARFKNDDVATFESREVAEALADMFALDYEMTEKRTGVGDPTFLQQVTDPDVYDHPYLYSQYDCSTTDPHDNGWVMDRVYMKIVRAFGTRKAGMILQGVPWMLPPGRTFATVKRAFMNVAVWNYGAASAEVGKIDSLFNSAGINTVTSDRAHTCPGKPA